MLKEDEIAEVFRLERYLGHVDALFERVFGPAVNAADDACASIEALDRASWHPGRAPTWPRAPLSYLFARVLAQAGRAHRHDTRRPPGRAPSSGPLTYALFLVGRLRGRPPAAGAGALDPAAGRRALRGGRAARDAGRWRAPTASCSTGTRTESQARARRHAGRGVRAAVQQGRQALHRAGGGDHRAPALRRERGLAGGLAGRGLAGRRPGRPGHAGQHVRGLHPHAGPAVPGGRPHPAGHRRGRATWSPSACAPRASARPTRRS